MLFVMLAPRPSRDPFVRTENPTSTFAPGSIQRGSSIPGAAGILATGPSRDPFISEDPIGFRGGDINLYSYVWNNPTLFADPFGLWSYAREYGTTGANLSPGIAGTEGAVDSVFQGLVNRDAVVTYTRNGVHKKDSLHYVGDAIDLRTRDLTAKQRATATAALQLLLGDDFDVIDEGDHIHVEYQPRPRPRCGIL